MRDIIKKILSEYVTETRKPKGYWDDENNLEIAAREFNNLTDFQKKNQTAYNKANKKGKDFFEKITNHMERPRSQRPYTDEELINIAKKYKTKTDFRKYDSGASQVAFKRGEDFWNRITSHMDFLASKSKRIVYAYFFPNNNAVYVGLTYDMEKRNFQHIEDEKHYTAVRRFIQETGEQPKLVKLTDYLPPDQASKKENDFIDTFKKEGYLILNRMKAGGLGGGFIYTDEDISKVASGFTNIKDFYKNATTFYKLARRRGLLDSLTKNMIRNQISWDKNKVLSIANNFTKLSDFRKSHNGAYEHAKKNDYLDELLNKFPTLRRTNVSREDLQYAASKFNNITDFQKNDSSNYSIAKRMGILDDITKHMDRKRKKNYSNKDLEEIALLYNSTKEFYTNDMTAYRSAKRRGDDFYKSITSHFIN
jgi:predicted GIY-YIG superfamily endonuclease